MAKLTTYVVVLAGFILLLSLWGFYFAIHPIRIISAVTPSTYGVQYEAVEFKTEDNVLIKGWYIPSKNPHAKTIVLLHGYPADKGDILPSRIFLHEKYNLLLFDFRYLGESQGSYSTIGRNETFDLKAALDFLHKRGVNEVGVWGLSLGAAVAILTAPDTPMIKAVVAEAPYARLDWMANSYYPLPGVDYVIGKLFHLWSRVFLGIDINTVQPVKAVEKLKIPLLIMYSKQDQVIRLEHALLMQEVIKNHPNVELIITEDGQHGEPIDNYQVIINEFFAKNLK